MKEKSTLHIIAAATFVVFIILGLACASIPELESENYELDSGYRVISINDLRDYEYEKGYPGQKFVTEASLTRNSRTLVYLNGIKRIGASIETLKEDWLERRIESGKIYKIYLTKKSSLDSEFVVDRIEGLMSVEEAQAIAARQEAARVAAEAERAAQAAERAAQEETRRQAEHERLANLYRQAGNNFGNLRNTTKRYSYTLGSDYVTVTINFGDGNYIRQTQSMLGMLSSPSTGTYRVNGDIVIFLSSGGEYSYGTIVGTALNIGGDIYR